MGRHNGPGVPGRRTRPPLAEALKQKVIELRAKGLLARQISEETAIPYQTVAKVLRDAGVNAGRGAATPPDEDVPDMIAGHTLIQAKEREIYKNNPEKLEELKQKRLAQYTNNSLQTTNNELKELAKTEDEAKERTVVLGHEILRGAERLISSINNMSDEALAMATLHHKATALGILVDKLRVLNNKANPMFGADSSQTINIINVIASAAPPRRKDTQQQVEVKTAKQQIDDAEIAEDKFSGF